MEELEHFISGLRDEGEVESGGAFTVPLDVAEEKLQQFQLLDSNFYITQLVAAAVAGGASFLRIDSRLCHLEFLCDSLAPSKGDLENLQSHLFHTVGAPEYLSELAIAVHGALGLPVSRVVIESFNEGESWQLELRADKQRMRRLTTISPVVPLLRVVVDKGFGLRTRLTSRHPEKELLHQARYAPLSLTYDGESLTEKKVLPLEEIHWSSVPCLGGQGAPEEKEEGYLAIVPVHVARSLGLTLVHNGLAMKRAAADLMTTNICGVVHVKGLRKNISQTDLVANAEYVAIIEELRLRALNLLVEFCTEPADSREHWPALTQPVERILRGHLPASSRAVLENWQTFALVSETQSEDDHRLLIERARVLDSEGHKSAAHQLRNEIKRRLQVQILDHFRKVNWDAVESLLSPLKEVLSDLQYSHLKRAYQAENILGCLLRGEGPSEEAFEKAYRWGLHRHALILRYQGQLVAAAGVHAKAIQVPREESSARGWAYRYCAEIELAQANYQEAEEFFEQAETHLVDCRDLYEERSFLKRLVSSESRREGVRLLKRALPGTESDPFVNWLFLDWLVREGRGILGWEEWIKLRARASVEEVKTKFHLGTRSEIESALNPQFHLLGWKSLKQAREERVIAVEQAEDEHGPNHPYTQFCRRRAIYQLHRLEAHTMADKLACRGHLLAQFERCISELD